MIDEAKYSSIHEYGNKAINALSDSPFKRIIERAAEETGMETKELSHLLEIAITHSSAISYLHLGRPETIVIHPNENASGVGKAH